MENAELKPKRIRHCYPRREIYHRFIHSDNHMYCDSISSIGNYLFCRKIKNITPQEVENNWSYFSSSVIAVIDRNAKRIIVKADYTECYMVLHAIPDDYEIFYSSNVIPSYNILSDEETELRVKVHLQNCIEYLTENYLWQFISVLTQNKKVLHSNFNNIYDNPRSRIATITKFVKKYKVKQYDWYNKSLNEKFNLSVYTPNYWSKIYYSIPSVKQVVTNTIFTKKEKDILAKRYFFTKYCYGRKIPYFDVDKYYNKELSIDDFINYIDRFPIYCNKDWFKTETTWNEYIKIVVDADIAAEKNYKLECEKKSEENRLKAIEEANKLNGEYSVDAWRKRISFNNKVREVKYRRWVYNYRSKSGMWIDSTVYVDATFPNTQLKLSGNTIVTSRCATVPLSEGIKAYKLFRSLISNNPDKFNFEFSKDKVNVGIYNLRFIRYINKTDDHHNNLGKKEWLIQIGCHSLWHDDILDFIHYYNLEEQFGIDERN